MKKEDFKNTMFVLPAVGGLEQQSKVLYRTIEIFGKYPSFLEDTVNLLCIRYIDGYKVQQYEDLNYILQMKDCKLIDGNDILKIPFFKKYDIVEHKNFPAYFGVVDRFESGQVYISRGVKDCFKFAPSELIKVDSANDLTYFKNRGEL